MVHDKPLPAPSLDSRPYWDGLREHRLLLQWCAACGTPRHYPRPVCDRCYSMEAEWREASGRGVIHSWTVAHHAFHPGFADELPYILVIVDLDEGVRLQSRLVDAGAEALSIGRRVEVLFAEGRDGMVLPLFRLVPETGGDTRSQAGCGD